MSRANFEMNAAAKPQQAAQSASGVFDKITTKALCVESGDGQVKAELLGLPKGVGFWITNNATKQVVALVSDNSASQTFIGLYGGSEPLTVDIGLVVGDDGQAYIQLTDENKIVYNLDVAVLKSLLVSKTEVQNGKSSNGSASGD